MCRGKYRFIAAFLDTFKTLSSIRQVADGRKVEGVRTDEVGMSTVCTFSVTLLINVN